MSWSRIEKELWENSEVWQEFNKKMQKAAAGLTEQLRQVNTEAPKASQSLQGVADAAKKLEDVDFAQDPFAENDGVEPPTEIEEEKTPEEILLDELHQMARTAALSGDIKTAYTIERAIQEITQEE